MGAVSVCIIAQEKSIACEQEHPFLRRALKYVF